MMHTKKLQFINLDEIQKLTDIIHDMWFNTDWIIFNQAESILTIPFGEVQYSKARMVANYVLLRKYTAVVAKSCLRVHNVKHYELFDRSKIGTYDFNDIKYLNGHITITTCEDLTIDVASDEFMIEIERTDEIIGEYQFRLILGIECGVNLKFDSKI
ncbi:MAG: hypothetical protein WC421_11490 [Elusimicrobiales bacterium]